MKNPTALRWIWSRTKRETPLLVLLTFSNALLSVCSVSLALLAKEIVDAAVNADRDRLIRFCVILLCVILLQVFLRILIKSLEVRVSGRMEMDYKRALFGAILSKDYSAVTAFHSGELLTRLTSDITLVTDTVTTLVPSVAAMLTKLVCAFLVILSLDKWFAAILLLAGLVVFSGTRIFRGKIKAMHRRVQETDGRLRSFLQEAIESLLAVQVFGVQKKVEAQALERAEENYDAKLSRNRWAIFANTGFSAAFAFGFLFALVFGGFRLCAGEISFGTLTALLQLVNQVQTPFSSLSGIVPKYYSMLASAERLMEIEDLPKDAPQATEIDAAALCRDFTGIRFDGVSFAYGQNEVLTDATFEILKNDFVVLSGISGIGKSTLFKLLLGVLSPVTGEISIEAGRKAYRAGKDTRALFAYVPQGNLLFSGTVRDNIRFIREDATDEEVKEAVRVSCADSFVYDLPKGLDTVLGEGGRGLSEGQIQRLAVARAVLTDAPVLLLDEATSALDEATERRLLENIRAMQNKTCIIISHKKAAFSICEKEVKIAKKKAVLKKIAET